MDRYIKKIILNDLKKKMVIISGPRQVGKTYLCKQILENFNKSTYLNYDSVDDQVIILNRTWPNDAPILAFDEIHKMKNWKQYLKGIYDSKPDAQSIIVTGSARLGELRRSGGSLAGRYFHHRLGPLSVKELPAIPPYESLDLLCTLGGFPEPFLSGSQEEAARWRMQYYSDIVREDILEFSRIHEIKAMRTLVELLRSRVGSPISFTSLSEDLRVSPNTIIKYISILESLYIVFIIRPYHKNIDRAILREPKIYFYDSGFVKGDDGIRLENACAVCLLKHVQFLQDTVGKDIDLYYIRTKDGREIDFAVGNEESISEIIEIKLSDNAIANNLKYFQKKLKTVSAIQLVHNIKKEYREDGIDVVSAGDWLSKLSA